MYVPGHPFIKGGAGVITRNLWHAQEPLSVFLFVCFATGIFPLQFGWETAEIMRNEIKPKLFFGHCYCIVVHYYLPALPPPPSTLSD